MKFKPIYILDIIVIVSLSFLIPGMFYEQKINNASLMIVSSLLLYIFYLYVYRFNPDRGVYNKLIDYLNHNIKEISIELQFLYIVFYKETDYFPIIKQNTDLTFNIDIYYNKVITDIDKIKKDISAVSSEFSYIIRNYIEVYNTLLDCIDYKERCENKLKSAKDFFKNKFYDEYFFNDKYFFKHPEWFINNLISIKKQKNKTESIKEKSYIPTMLNKQGSLIFGRFLYFTIHYSGYVGTYIKYQDDVKLVEEYKYEYQD